MQRIILPLLIVLLFCACKTSALLTQPDTVIQRLGLCVDYDPSVPAEARLLFDRQLQDFIALYNTQHRPFHLQPCSDPETTSLRLYITDTKLVGSGEQTAGVVLSAIGLAVPLMLVTAGIPAYAGFCYLPKNISRVEMSLSEDISGQQEATVSKKFFNPGFLMTMEKQLQRHSRKFGYFLQHTLADLERGYAKQQKETLLTKSEKPGSRPH